MDISILQNIWFCLLALLLGMFLTLGGFDFGACILSAKSKRAGDFALGGIVPFWDANQVWLITAGGALFAAFPAAYSSALANLYIPVMLLLATIIARVAAIEFYFVKDSAKWRNCWRRTAAGSSALAMLLFGIALGVIFTGKVFGRTGTFSEKFFALFSFSTILCGIAALLFSCVHGALFLCFKSAEGRELFAKTCGNSFKLLLAAYALYILSLSLEVSEIIFFIGSYAVLQISHICFLRKRFGFALIFSGIFALLAVAAHAFAAYPNIIAPEITLADSSSAKTLSIMLAVAGVGVPIILGYTIYVYRVFLRKAPRKP